MFSDLKKDIQDEIINFNRFVLECHYPDDAPQTPNWLARKCKRDWDIKVERVRIYLCPEHKKHMEKLELKTQIINKDTATNIIPFLTPPGAKWNDLEMTIIGYEKVKLKVKSEIQTTDYIKMGFEYRRTGKPNDAWKRLTEFACNKGMLTNFSSTENGFFRRSEARRLCCAFYHRAESSPELQECS